MNIFFSFLIFIMNWCDNIRQYSVVTPCIERTNGSVYFKRFFTYFLLNEPVLRGHLNEGVTSEGPLLNTIQGSL